jgi:hypothetical protein
MLIVLRQVHQSVASEASLFSFVEGIGRGDPVFGPLPAYPHPRKRRSDGLPANAPFGEPFLEADLGGHLHSPQATIFAELSGTTPVKHLAQSLGPFRIEGSMNGVRAIRASLERLRKALLVEDVDGVAHRLGVTTKVAGDLVSVLSISAFEQDLATTQSEGIRRAQPRLQGIVLAPLKGRTKIGRFMV